MNLYLRDIMLQFETVRAVRDSGATIASFFSFFIIIFPFFFFLLELVFLPPKLFDKVSCLIKTHLMRLTDKTNTTHLMRLTDKTNTTHLMRLTDKTITHKATHPKRLTDTVSLTV